MLADPRFEIRAASFQTPDVPEACQPYLRTMSEQDGPAHSRLRRLVSPAFTVRRAAAFRPSIERIVDGLLSRSRPSPGPATAPSMCSPPSPGPCRSR